jgi:PTS system beta-glucosides-specific IIC component/PTS system sucrose-specific IIC component
MANTAQGGAALAVYFKTNRTKMKAIALPAATSCLLGITEAAIFGVNLRLVKPFVAAAFGGLIGGAYVVFTNVGMTALGLTALPGMSIVESGSLVNYIIGMVLAFGGAFIITWILGFEEEPDAEAVIENSEENEAEPEKEADLIENNNENNVEKVKTELLSPVKGEILELSEVPDPTFAQKILGDGIAFKPEIGEIVAPVDAEVVNLFDTKHALGLKTESGAEVLIHIGLDTVKMGGEGFEAFVEQGDNVKAGDKLIEVDLNLVEEKAESIITPMVITNTADFEEITSTAAGQINFGDKVLEIKA